LKSERKKPTLTLSLLKKGGGAGEGVVGGREKKKRDCSFPPVFPSGRAGEKIFPLPPVVPVLGEGREKGEKGRGPPPLFGGVLISVKRGKNIALSCAISNRKLLHKNQARELLLITI